MFVVPPKLVTPVVFKLVVFTVVNVGVRLVAIWISLPFCVTSMLLPAV